MKSKTFRNKPLSWTGAFQACSGLVDEDMQSESGSGSPGGLFLLKVSRFYSLSPAVFKPILTVHFLNIFMVQLFM